MARTPIYNWKQVFLRSFDPILNGIRTTTGLLTGVSYDAIDVEQTSPSIDTFLYYTGGIGGTLQATVVITYTDECKTDIDTVVRT